jgi:branched-chain amino acid aminotransferase
MILWLNGALQDSGVACIDPADRGLLFGDGLFETMTARGGKVAQLEAHAARLRQGCDVLRLPYPNIDLDHATQSVLNANHLTDAVLRLTWTRGSGPRGLQPPEVPQPTLLITAAPLPPPRPPARCIIATVSRRNEHSPLSRIKSLNYLDNILAKQEAGERGADEAILLNTAGRLAEASAANLFIVKDSHVFTPPVTDGALPGLMRARILAATNGIEQSLVPEDLETANEIFLTSSLGIRPVTHIDDVAIGQANPGSVFRMLNENI